MIDLLLTNARVRSGPALEHSMISTMVLAGGTIQACVPVEQGVVWERQAKHKIDLQGALVLPGLVDSHTHLGWAGQALWEVNWQGVDDRVSALERVRIAASRIGRGFWLLGGNWSRAKLVDAELPSLAELDQITGDIPLFFASEDNSLALVNSRAMMLCQAALSIPPAGGAYERDGRGNLTGRLLGTAARSRVTAGIIPPRDRYRQLAELRAAMGVLAQHGITEAHDIATFPYNGPTPLVFDERSFTDITLYDELEDRCQLTVRVSVRPPLKRWQEVAAEVERRKHRRGLVTCHGVKLLLDSGLYSKPFPGGRYSYRYPGFETALQWMCGADQAGLQVSVHALGDLGVRETLDLFEQVQKSGMDWSRRQRLVHGIRIAPEDISRIARLRVIVEAQPWDMIDEPETRRRHFDDEFLATAYPYRSLLDAGVPVMFGSDWRMPHRSDQIDLDPLVAMYAAVTRTSPGGASPPPEPHQRITISEAIQCYTRSAAWAEYAEDRRGALQPGMDADLVVLSKDIVDKSPSALLEARVLLTLVDGKVVYDPDNVSPSH